MDRRDIAVIRARLIFLSLRYSSRITSNLASFSPMISCFAKPTAVHVIRIISERRRSIRPWSFEFDPLRDDPRFQDLLLRMNLEP